MTPAGFPHSEILGSKLAWQLPEAYRSLLRPLSSPSAKAFTVDPYKLGCRESKTTCSLCSSQDARSSHAQAIKWLERGLLHD